MDQAAFVCDSQDLSCFLDGERSGSALCYAFVGYLVDEEAGLGWVITMLVSCPTSTVRECDRFGVPQYLLRLLCWQDVLLDLEGLSDWYHLCGRGEFSTLDPLIVSPHHVG
jgi:hypothetical protein